LSNFDARPTCTFGVHGRCHGSWLIAVTDSGSGRR
jgi:hypothetical protein